MSKVVVLMEGFQQSRNLDSKPLWSDMNPMNPLALTGVVQAYSPVGDRMRFRFESEEAATAAAQLTGWPTVPDDSTVLISEQMVSGRDHPERCFVTFFTGWVRVAYFRAEEMTTEQYEVWKRTNPPQHPEPKLGVRWAGDDHMETCGIFRPSLVRPIPKELIDTEFDPVAHRQKVNELMALQERLKGEDVIPHPTSNTKQ